MAAIDELLDELGDGDSKDVLLLIRELSGFVSYYRRLLERFELDSLTGLPGSNKYHELKEDLEKHPTESVGVIMFDVNDLKYYNDNKGHQAGDLLLQKAAESFHYICDHKSYRRDVDSKKFNAVFPNIRVFRTGGDEFVAIITGCDEGDLEDIVALWQRKLEELNLAKDGVTCNVAYGTAWASGAYDINDAVKLADERMYAEKKRMKECGLKRGEMR
jgi:diguanylate cyclase (GGDEF)-like protein